MTPQQKDVNVPTEEDVTRWAESLYKQLVDDDCVPASNPLVPEAYTKGVLVSKIKSILWATKVW
jgi:hypothetical protein